MKTDELINLLAADAPSRARLGRAVLVALAAGVLVSAVLMLATVGLRPGMAEAMDSMRVQFKLGATALLAVLASWLALRIGRPGVPSRGRALALLVPALLLAVAVALEFAVVPPGSREQAMIGRSSDFCLFFIPVLSLAPLAGLLLALRESAPERPMLAGAVAGLAAGAIGAALYAWHCGDDSPFFVAVWYVTAIAMVTAAGALLGRRLLRW